ncbi:substrate-binding domain-containing protein [Candidatus Thiodiazotropha sp. CDECU1]|uniref:substrate-binding domain-containing protein n=1 Tax=Candidatus Thiodiazotropha sp. CDECU1 TaxID=3065865 RepID=UPI00292D7C01|nr:phosphate/phosphite/phosphonate ABC transporter substrate-binding protein [Candidatus Thiodiazotropha sp. CDECU1]
MRLICLLMLIWINPVFASETEPPIRFGLTAVVVTENLRFLDQWSQYLGQKMNRKVEFVLRKSYQDVMDLLDSGGIDFAWICGYPYVQIRKPESLQLLTVPIYRGAPRYHSYIIVHHDSPDQHFSDLKGKIFAFSDPDSNSGFLYPLSLMIEKGEKPETFFRHTFFTFNHAETVQAVSEQVADAGAVDSYIWEYLAIFRPDITEKTRIIKTSPSFGFPPIVSRVGVNDATVGLMKSTLERMDEDSAGKALLENLKLDGFGHFSDSLFNDIRAMVYKIKRSDPIYSMLPTD